MARIIASSAPEASTLGSNPQPADPASLSEKAATLIEVQTARSEARKRYSIKVASADAEVYARKLELDTKLANAYLGQFFFQFKYNKADRITSKFLRHQVKVQPEHVRWLQANLEKGRAELLDPIVVAVSPSNLTASGQADIQQDSVPQYAMRLTKAIVKNDEGAMRTLRRDYVKPDGLHHFFWLPKERKAEEEITDPLLAIHLLDGQKRIAALRNIQGEMVADAQNRFNDVQGLVYNWDIIYKEQELLDYLVQRPEPMRNVPGGGDQIKRKLLAFSAAFVPGHGRYKKVHEEYERKERPEGTASASTGKSVGGKLDDLVLGSRNLRVSLQSSLSTAQALDAFRYEPYYDLLKAGLPELATYAATLWSYQQRLICTVLAVHDSDGNLFVRHLSEFLIKDALDTIRSLPRPEADEPLADQIGCARQALDQRFEWAKEPSPRSEPIHMPRQPFRLEEQGHCVCAVIHG
ncbi:hypothetical protein CF319_g7576 [Tilletia indica]|nr:hypothetical protein CF319_g7576 [Tilletia indica]